MQDVNSQDKFLFIHNLRDQIHVFLFIDSLSTLQLPRLFASDHPGMRQGIQPLALNICFLGFLFYH